MNHVYLHETADDEAGIYACLSHRWGNQTVLKTTSATLQDYKKNIPWAELPKTFQDAMSFTFRLGIGHLWIDSLCILQDSAEDWRHEGSMMSKIYEGSYVTLAATVAADASEGLFRTSSPDSMYQSFDYTRTDGQIYDVKCRSALTHWSISTNPLIQRPWVYQERLLSARLIHFMDHELWFECCAGFQCECARNEYDGYFDRNDFKPDLDKSIRNAVDTQTLEHKWQMLVSSYAMKAQHLTFADDIFPALQGIAKIVPPIMGAYLAGHWAKHLDKSLCWYHNPNATRASKTRAWRAPSWSWASVSGYVKWQIHSGLWDGNDEQMHMFITVVEVTTSPVGWDPTGQLLSGTIKLVGQCLPGEVAWAYSRRTSDEPTCFIIFNKGPEEFSTRLSHDHRRYVYWDYLVHEPGPYQVSNGASVVILRLNCTQGGERAWMILKLSMER